MSTSDFAAFAGCFGLSCNQCGGCAGPAAAATASASTEPVVAIRVAVVTEPTSADRAISLPRSITCAAIGQTLMIEVWAMRADESLEDAVGLAAAYVDISYDPRLLSIVAIRPSSVFSLFSNGYDENGILRAVGGCALLGERYLGTEGTWVRVATITARAEAPGTGTLRVDSSDPIHGIALVGEFANVDSGKIEFEEINFVVEPKNRGRRDLSTR